MTARSQISPLDVNESNSQWSASILTLPNPINQTEILNTWTNHPETPQVKETSMSTKGLIQTQQEVFSFFPGVNNFDFSIIKDVKMIWFDSSLVFPLWPHRKDLDCWKNWSCLTVAVFFLETSNLLFWVSSFRPHQGYPTPHCDWWLWWHC